MGFLSLSLLLNVCSGFLSVCPGLKQHFSPGLRLKALAFLILTHPGAGVTFLDVSYLFMPSCFRKDVGTCRHLIMLLLCSQYNSCHCFRSNMPGMESRAFQDLMPGCPSRLGSGHRNPDAHFAQLPAARTTKQVPLVTSERLLPEKLL